MVAIRRLTISNVRNLQQVELTPEPGINIITGPNGAGKTSLLEAIYILGRGRSFRSRRSNDWITRGADKARVVAEINHSQPAVTTAQNTVLGLERDRKTWLARINGETVNSFAQLSRQLPLVLFEPNAHELINGGPEQRRTFLDWGVFHVEPDYVPQWRRYYRAVRQRNAALREKAPVSLIHSLSPAIATAAAALDQMRQLFFQRLEAVYTSLYQQLQPDIPPAVLSYQRGWPDEQPLEALLHSELSKDMENGYTRHGCHRADIVMHHQQRQLRGWLSRGQQKLMALLLLLAQQETWSTHNNKPPLIMLDDLYSELDVSHSRSVLQLLSGLSAQVWITATDDTLMREYDAGRFHVEHGQLT